MTDTVQPTQDMKQANSPHENSMAKRLTGAEHDESMMVAGVIAREIRHSGKFSERLGDYAYAYARGRQGVTPERAEAIIRDQFKAMHGGQSMNQFRESLMAREKNLDGNDRAKAIGNARGIGQLIQDGETMPFYRAYDKQAVNLASQLGITESGAKSLMREAFKEQEGRELYDWGKELEKEHHFPRREATSKAREAEQDQHRNTPRPRA